MKRTRVILAAVMMLGSVGWILLLARSYAGEPQSLASWIITLLGAPTAVVLLGALYEWIVHRFVYHGPSSVPLLQAIHEIHTRGHHWHRFPPDHYVERGPVERIPVWPAEPHGLCGSSTRRALAWAGQYALYLCVATPFAFVPVGLVTRNAQFTFSFITVGLVVCYLFIRVHDVIHYPRGRFIERRAAFQFLDRHHYIHHVDNAANLNFLLPLGDLLFGTLRLHCTAAEAARWPSFAAARLLPAPDPVAASSTPGTRRKAQITSVGAASSR